MTTAQASSQQRPRACLVTGGAGFIGSHLVDVLLAQGDSVTVVDDLSTGRRENLAHALAGAGTRLSLFESDLAHALRGPLATAQFDEIYHLAAAVGVALVVQDPLRCIHTNVHQTSELLEYARSHGTSRLGACTFLASSSEVYGKGVKSPFAEGDDVVYGSTDKPRWSYAASKAIDEYLGLAHHTQHGLPVTIARFFNTIGPRQRGEYGMVVPRFVRSALEGRDLEVYGDGEQSRCFCDVRDVAGVLPLLVRTPPCVGKVFNVGSERSITMNELARLVLSQIGGGGRVRHIPYERVYGEAFEDLRVRVPDLMRVRGAVGFAPSIPLERTILDIAREQRA